MNLETLEQNKEFRCRYSIGEITITPKSSGHERPIDKIQFQRVWRRACKLPREEQFKPGSYQDITVNSSYILVLMKYTVQNEPIECEPIQDRKKRWKVWKASE